MCEGIRLAPLADAAPAPRVDPVAAAATADEWAAWLRRFPEDEAVAVDEARRWITDFVVPLALCPHAAAAAARTRVAVSRAGAAADLVADVVAEARRLLVSPEVPTALVAAPAFVDLGDFLDIVYDLDDGGTGDEDLDEAVLIAPFHPDFAYAGVEDDSALHFEKRAPLPLVSILRAADVDDVGGADATARIAAANEETLAARSGASVAALFQTLRGRR